ncbi:MAG: choice-of-anchor V domain-containing protein [Bacteroidales bacterium]
MNIKKVFSFWPVLIILMAASGLISWRYSLPEVQYPTGAPAGHTGSPADGKTCTECHTGSTGEFQAGWITSNIPVTGYVPGETYTITATVTSSGRSKFGFQVSPQDGTGKLLGTLNSTSGQTQLTGSDKYITHTSSGTTGSNSSKSWTFNWFAPAKGTGEVTFYGAFNATNSDNATTGDIIYTSSLTVSENTTVGIEDIIASKKAVKVYPNPTSDKINLKYKISINGLVEIKLYSLGGKNTSVLFSGNRTKGEYDENYSLNRAVISKGIYFLEIKANGKSSVEKVLIE